MVALRRKTLPLRENESCRDTRRHSTGIPNILRISHLLDPNEVLIRFLYAANSAARCLRPTLRQEVSQARRTRKRRAFDEARPLHTRSKPREDLQPFGSPTTCVNLVLSRTRCHLISR